MWSNLQRKNLTSPPTNSSQSDNQRTINQYLKNTPNEVTVYILLNKLLIKYMFRTLLTITLTIMLLSCIRSETKVNQNLIICFQI